MRQRIANMNLLHFMVSYNRLLYIMSVCYTPINLCNFQQQISFQDAVYVFCSKGIYMVGEMQRLITY